MGDDRRLSSQDWAWLVALLVILLIGLSRFTSAFTFRTMFCSAGCWAD